MYLYLFQIIFWETFDITEKAHELHMCNHMLKSHVKHIWNSHEMWFWNIFMV